MRGWLLEVSSDPYSQAHTCMWPLGVSSVQIAGRACLPLCCDTTSAGTCCCTSTRMHIFFVCRFKPAAERATLTETFTCKIKLLMGINDRPGWSVMTRVSKNPSRVGACYSCHQEGVAVYGGSKPAYPGWQLLCCCHALPCTAHVHSKPDCMVPS